MVQLNDELVGLLDEEAARRDLSRSAIIREAVETYLAERREVVLVRSIIEGYRRVPQTEADGWVEMAALADRSTAEMLARLGQEESSHGSGSW